MLTSAQIRQSYLDFFREKQHTIVPSSSLLPDSPNLLFTNAGMNQFVPIFLGERSADVSKWAGAIPGSDTRAADTQKCIRAGGKHNDLDDVGLDTYHHTFFEMLGNWSFGDYFKKEAIEWAWELVINRWKFPATRLYATVYAPGKGDPADFDQEAYDHWATLFTAAGLDPKTHIVYGNKKDNFWMMGDTGPCGPCSELHIDLTPAGDTKGSLVNAGDPRCIEIWNLVFIQFNANPDGTFSPLPAKHVDTGMGFERVASIIQGTKGFTDFENAKISNYETDIFRSIFDEIEKLSGKKYASTLPVSGGTAETEQEKIDVAFRVIADHIRTLSFAIADGIQPGNNDRNYVLRRILRRAVRYGRTLSFHEPFFYKLVDVLVRHMGDVFPEIRTKQKHIEDTLKREEEAFNRTLDKGIALFEAEVKRLEKSIETLFIPLPGAQTFHDIQYWDHPPHFQGMNYIKFSTHNERKLSPEARSIVLNSLRRFEGKRYELFALCVMPQGVHALWRPLVKGFDDHGNKSYWPREEILADLKSFTTSEINREEATTDEIVWKQQSYDNPSLSMKSDADLKETFYDICRRPWTEHVAKPTEKYPWLWIWNDLVGSESATQRDAGIPHERGSREASKLATPSTTPRVISGAFAFRLYDEQGFPIDLTQLMARERGLAIDVAEFDRLMENQRERARRAQKKQVIELSEIETKEPTKFIGYDSLSTPAKVLEVVDLKDKAAVILDTTVAYAEMGGQVGDTGELAEGGQLWRVLNTRKNGNTWLHLIESGDTPAEGNEVTLSVDIPRRAAIQRHHTVTHLLHWALHEVVSKEASQKGSFVGPDKLTFDFNSAALTPQQVHDVEQLVNERILENAPVTWTEVPYASVRGRSDIMQFFGDKYGETVRVVDIGGYSKELCAGTHTRATGEIGLFRIVSEAAIQAGVRRIEAVAGFTAYDATVSDLERLKSFAQKLNSPLGEIEKKLDAFIARQTELEKALKSARQREAASRAKTLVSSAETIHGIPAIISDLGTADPDTLQSIADALKGTFEGSVLLAGNENGVVSLVSTVSPSFVSKIQAGKLIQTIAPIMGGKGGGRPDAARGAGKDPSKISEALAAAKQLLAHG